MFLRQQWSRHLFDLRSTVYIYQYACCEEEEVVEASSFDACEIDV